MKAPCGTREIGRQADDSALGGVSRSVFDAAVARILRLDLRRRDYVGGSLCIPPSSVAGAV